MVKVALRAEVNGMDRRYLDASLDENGDLVIAGQDLGPGTSMAPPHGEYEWWTTIKAVDFPELLALLDAPSGSDVLQVLADHWTGEQSYELERRLRESAIPRAFAAYP